MNMSNQITNRRVRETVEVRFDGFENLPARKGVDFVNSKFSCLGHDWGLRVIPGGYAASGDGFVAVYLYHDSGGSIEVQTRITVKSGANIVGGVALKYGNVQYGELEDIAMGNFAKRETLIGALVEGALIIEVSMRKDEPSAPPMPFTPENPFCKIMLTKFMEEKSTDVAFEVGDEKEMIRAHRLILEDSAPTLFNLCTSGSDSASIPITNVKPDIFRHLLRYIYGENIPAEYLKENAKDIIGAADRYEVVNLKLEAEAALVVSTTITIDYVVETLLYSHDKNCPLLKEAAIDFIVVNLADVLQKVSLMDAPGALLIDLLTAVARGGKELEASVGSNNDLNNMRVSDLREKLHDKGLGIDGSREAMIARLEESS